MQTVKSKIVSHKKSNSTILRAISQFTQFSSRFQMSERIVDVFSKPYYTKKYL